MIRSCINIVVDKITRGYQSLEGVESEPKEGRNTKMTDKVMENNRVAIIGEVVSDFEFSHEVFGEGFYMLEVSVNRLSNQPDIIPLMVSERLVDVTKDYKGQIIEVNGQFRSYNRHEGSRNRLVLSISGPVYFCERVGNFRRWNRFRKDQSDLFGRLYLQTSYLSKNTIRKRNRGFISCGKPSLWKIRLYSLHRMGQKCQIPDRCQICGKL